jgi:phage tail sheath gpL-like
MTYERSTHVTRAIKELQDERFQISAGANVGIKIDVADIRERDTIKRVLHNTAGVFVDLTPDASIFDIRAVGTITVSSPAVDDSVTVDGVVFVMRAAGTTVLQTSLTGEEDIGFSEGVSDADTAANLVESINSVLGRRIDSVVASDAGGGVVDLTAQQEGTVGNSITLVDSAGGLTVSGATLTGGTDTGGISTTVDTTGDELHITWNDKPSGDDASG